MPSGRLVCEKPHKAVRSCCCNQVAFAIDPDSCFIRRNLRVGGGCRGTARERQRHSDEQVLRVLDRRKAQGFTVVQVFAARSWGQWASSDLTWSHTDSEGNLPFVDGRPVQLTPEYWRRWLWIADQAANRGLQLLVMVGEPGRRDTLWPLKSLDEAYEYGRKVGELFRQTAEHDLQHRPGLGRERRRRRRGLSRHCRRCGRWRERPESGSTTAADYSTTLDDPPSLHDYLGLVSERQVGGHQRNSGQPEEFGLRLRFREALSRS